MLSSDAHQHHFHTAQLPSHIHHVLVCPQPGSGILQPLSWYALLSGSLRDILALHGGVQSIDRLRRLCESVAANLVGQKLGGMRRISSAVKGALEQALTRILTPGRSIDVLREVQAAKAKGKPYTMVFVGVNGVGKSTNLAKIAYWLLQNNIKVSPAWLEHSQVACAFWEKL